MANVAPTERVLPHNLEAEKCVLGAILIHDDAFHEAVEFIDSKDFFREAHRRIFDKMVDLSERRHAIDFVTLKEELGRDGRLEDVGGPAYIAALVDGVPRSSNIQHYARIVKEKAILRSLIHSATKIASTAYDADQDADELLDEAERTIFQIAEDRVGEGFVSLRTLVQKSFGTIERLHEHKGAITAVPCGFADLDALTSGLQPADLIIVAARPSMGKTSLVLNIAANVGIGSGKTVGFFSLEMAKDQLFLRLLSADARVDAQRFRSGFLTEKDYGRISESLGRLSEATIFIDDSPSIGALEMRAKARRLMAEHGLELLIVDYIQLMQGRGRFENRTQELGTISRSLKILAKELNVPIVVLSQLSRAPEARSDGRPQLSDLRESGALEQDADVVVLIYREDVYKPTEQNDGIAQLIVAKQRNGPTGTVKVAFLKQFTRFEDLDWQQTQQS